MKKTLTALGTVAFIGIGALATATPAGAFVWWIAPAIIGGAAAGGAIANDAYNYSYGPDYYAYGPAPGTVYARPYAEATCHVVRERVPGGWRRVEVCD